MGDCQWPWRSGSTLLQEGIPGGIMPAYRRIRSFRPVLLIAMALLAFALVVPAGSASGAPTGHVGRSGAAASAAATPSAAGAFVPVAPSRLLDTRNGVGA